MLPRSDAPAGLRIASAWRAFPRSKVPTLRGWGVLLDVSAHFLNRVAKVKRFFLGKISVLFLDNISYYFLCRKSYRHGAAEAGIDGRSYLIRGENETGCWRCDVDNKDVSITGVTLSRSRNNESGQAV